MTHIPLTVLRAVAFGGSISATGLLVRGCGSLSEIGPRNVPLQPPDWVFGVVWPCLYLTTGVAWALGQEGADPVLAAVTLLCCGWLVFYACLKRKILAALTLAAVVTLTVFAAVSLGGTAGGLLVPLAVWTAFATYLNAYDVLRPPGSDAT